MNGYGHVVLVDANIWFSRTLRDWVCLLATDPRSSLFTVLWTDDILAEVLSNLRKKNPNWNGGQISDISEKIKESFPNGQVRDFRPTDNPADLFDGHVIGAAIAGDADILLTNDGKGFSEEHDFRFEVMNVDDFLMLVAHSSRNLIVRTALRTAIHFHKRGVPYLEAERLKSAGAPKFARFVAELRVCEMSLEKAEHMLARLERPVDRLADR
ncbi:PIN domain-containing protein [Schaalia sp. 19OD2882]|uniref:PIN domain-containing protein n=1 Tax=Schaalia sp. 19OD2882 TaxID=2794089 RepID=UPI001C1EF646|nr:PIN domain-containing protein [Schaalia sp. 19OD2882]QWW19510.1 PIN domain-containing protein [Schaalia sp. 19OD2882]